MNHLDPVGRYLPSSLDVSRAAARRHELLAGVRARRAAAAGRPTALRRSRSLVPGALRRSAAVATESPGPVPGSAQRIRALAEAPSGVERHEGHDERRRADVDVAA